MNRSISPDCAAAGSTRPRAFLLLLSLLFFAIFPALPAHAETSPVTWNPLAQQYAEPDTTFLLDGAVEPGLSALRGGFIPGRLGQTDLHSVVDIVPGRFRAGVQSRGGGGDYIYMPLNGLLPTDQFTVEFWVKSPVTPWSQMSNNTLLVLGDRLNNYSFIANRGAISFREGTSQTPTGTSSLTMAGSGPALTAGWAANEWHNVAGTLKDNVITLYVDGAAVTSASVAFPIKTISGINVRDGLLIGGTITDLGQSMFAISDLRISRYARTPNAITAIDGTVTIHVDTDQPTDSSINQKLLGGLHWMRQGKMYDSFPDGTSYSEKMLGNPDGMNGSSLLYGITTDHFLNATPIAAGAPDAAHPSRGYSGIYSYDWTNVDLEMRYLRRMGVKLMLSIDSTPKILGGTFAPYTPAMAISQEPWLAPWNANVPNDGTGPLSSSTLAAFSTMATDLLHHIVDDLGDGGVIDRVTIWNEPDASSFWAGTLPQWYTLYNATAKAVKSSFPALKVGGAVFATFNTGHYTDFLSSAAAAGAPVDFLSFHYYTGDIADLDWQCAWLRAQARKYGFGENIDLTINEWANTPLWKPADGLAPLNQDYSLFLGDTSAAFGASVLMGMQRNNVTAACYTFPVVELAGLNLPPIDLLSGLFSNSHPWSNGNVFRLWHKMAPRVIASSTTAAPIQYIASEDPATHRITVLLSYPRARKIDPALRDAGGRMLTTDLPVTIALPHYTFPCRMTDYVIDDQHSDFLDAGPAHADLETIPANGLSTTMRARSVHLLEITPMPLASISIAPAAVTGGMQATGTVQLPGVTPIATTVTISSDSGLVSLPATAFIPAGSSVSAPFTVNTTAVSREVTAHITATMGSSAVSAPLAIEPPDVAALTPESRYLPGGSAGLATAYLNAPAPANGLVVSISSDNAALSPPSSVTVPAGQSSVAFTFSTRSVATPVTALLTAHSSSAAQSAAIAIGPEKLASISVPASVQSGQTSTGTITLGDTATGPVKVFLFGASAVSIPSFAEVAAGQKSVTFPITANTVSSDTNAVISASFSFNAPAVSANVLVKPSSPAIAHTFPAGLQLISVPADYGGVPLTAALDTASPLLAVWLPATMQYAVSTQSPADRLRPGQGYWAKFPANVDLFDLGTPTPIAPFQLSLMTGWNMIGDPFPENVPIPSIKVADGNRVYTFDQAVAGNLLAPAIYAYPAGATAYQPVDQSGSLAPYAGYWVYASRNCTLLILPPSSR